MLVVLAIDLLVLLPVVVLVFVEVLSLVLWFEPVVCPIAWLWLPPFVVVLVVPRLSLEPLLELLFVLYELPPSLVPFEVPCEVPFVSDVPSLMLSFVPLVSVLLWLSLVPFEVPFVSDWPSLLLSLVLVFVPLDTCLLSLPISARVAYILKIFFLTISSSASLTKDEIIIKPYSGLLLITSANLSTP